MMYNQITDYAADMNIVLTYFHFVDDWQDEKSKTGLAGIRLLHKTYLGIQEKYPDKCRKIKRCLQRLRAAEKRNEENVDLVARYFGELMAELLYIRKTYGNRRLRSLVFIWENIFIF